MTEDVFEDDERRIRLRDIDGDALKVVRRLLLAGHDAYLVGGCVRDLYLGYKPKDFDVATSATPEQVKRIFRNSRIIGRRFKLAHVFFGSKVIETATFRAPPSSTDDEEDPLITHDNEYGSIEDDARRRDFTINALFYDVETGGIADFVDGLSDLDRGIIRTIGDPRVRFQEDPVRMIRAIKFAARLKFEIEPETKEALLETTPDIAKCSRARLLEELYKLMRSGKSQASLAALHHAGLLGYIWPDYVALFEEEGGLVGPEVAHATEHPRAYALWHYLHALDEYVATTRHVPSNGVMQAIFFAPILGDQLTEAPRGELDGLIDSIMTPPGAALGVARRNRELARQIMVTHRRLLQPAKGRNKNGLIHRNYFHDALIFLGLSVHARDEDGGALDYWQRIATRPRTTPEQDVERDDRGRRKRRRGGRRRRRSRGGEAHRPGGKARGASAD